MLSSALLGCKKESDTEAPTIIVEDLFFYYNIWGNVKIVCDVNDNNSLEYITIQLLASEEFAIASSVVFRLESHSFEGNLNLKIDNPNIQSGLYSIKVKANDGKG